MQNFVGKTKFIAGYMKVANDLTRVATLCQSILNAIRNSLESLNFVAFTKLNKHINNSKYFSTNWPNLFSDNFATVGEF